MSRAIDKTQASINKPKAEQVGDEVRIEAIYRGMMEVCIAYEHREFARLRSLGQKTGE